MAVPAIRGSAKHQRLCGRRGSEEAQVVEAVGIEHLAIRLIQTIL